MKTNGELLALVEEWAREYKPTEFADTQRQVAVPNRYRRYLLRLIELRVEAEPEWARKVPVSVLDETSLMRVYVDPKSGAQLTVAGTMYAKATALRWRDLALPKEQLQAMIDTIVGLDLERV